MPRFLFYLLQTLSSMESKRRSLRNISSCNQLPNLFRPTPQSHNIHQYIPQSILEKISKTSTISCECIERLPDFQCEGQLEEQGQRCIRAAEYQLSWQEQMTYAPNFIEKPENIWQNNQDQLCPNKPAPPPRTTSSPVKIRHQQSTPKKRVSPWEDSIFLERLNEFIGNDPYEGGTGFSSEQFLEK